MTILDWFFGRTERAERLQKFDAAFDELEQFKRELHEANSPNETDRRISEARDLALEGLEGLTNGRQRASRPG